MLVTKIVSENSMLSTIDKGNEERTTVANNTQNDNNFPVKIKYEKSFVAISYLFYTAVNQITTSQIFPDDDRDVVEGVDSEE